jgi:hypothetical protein
MLAADDGRSFIPENGVGKEKYESRMVDESSWTALPDLILTLIPTAILVILGTEDGRPPENVDVAVRQFVLSIMVCVGTFTLVEKLRSPEKHGLAVLGSLVYSTVLPFTVSVGESKALGYMDFSLTMAYMTVSIFCVNPSLSNVCQWAVILPAPGYLPALLYMTIFEAISNTAHSSLNFEEVSLISHAITHTLFYVTQTPAAALSPHELFLPALTFGMLIAISPAVPLLRKIRESKQPTILAITSYAFIGISIILGVRGWLVACLGQDPFLWVLNYMTSSQGYEIRLAIIIWWFVVLVFGILVPVTFFTTSADIDNGESLNKRRKFFHGIVVLLFLPALNLDVFLL